MERARLLCELVRKREKLKAALIRTKEACVMMELNPIEATMTKLLEAVALKDTADIFGEPVDVNEVPDYMDVVTHPMDLSTMKLKLGSGLYYSLEDLEFDFSLMIKNCLAYNNKDTIFYRAGIRMRDQCAPLFRAARRDLERDGLVEKQKTDDSIVQEIDDEFREIIKMPPSEELMQKLQTLLDKTLSLKAGIVRAKRTKHIRIEMSKTKKLINKSIRKVLSDSSQSDTEVPEKINDELQHTIVHQLSQQQVQPLLQQQKEQLQLMQLQQQQTPPCSPLKSANNSASPSGVNRR